MKKRFKLLFLCGSLLLAFSLSTSTSSCSKKTGCPINENAGVQTGKKGKLPTRRGKSNLFPKKMRKKRN